MLSKDGKLCMMTVQWAHAVVESRQAAVKPDAYLSVETARPHESIVQNVSSVGGSNDNDTSVALKAIHLCKQLVQGLLTLIIATSNSSTT